MIEKNTVFIDILWTKSVAGHILYLCTENDFHIIRNSNPFGGEDGINKRRG
jgi:hypothetical protein